jgi:transcriptional regulator with XRE-family HTH domain
VLTKDQVETLKRSRVRGRNRLAKAMELADVTQVQIAAKTTFTQSYISRVKNGNYSDLPGETMRAFADYFGCAIEDLFPAREAVAS